jgi:hypothetical protein
VSPRIVSPRLARQVVLGSTGFQLTSLALGLFVWLAAAALVSTDLRACTEGSVRRSTGHVIDWQPTNTSVMNRLVLAVTFRYAATPGAAESRFGLAYTDGPPPAEGRALVVEVPVAQPGRPRVEGMRRGLLPLGVSLTGLVPLALTLLVLYAFYRRGLGWVALLERGVAAPSLLVSQTKEFLQRPPRYRLTFAFRDQAGVRRVVVLRTRDPGAYVGLAEPPVLYDPGRPARAVLLASLPGAPHLDARDAWVDHDGPTWLRELEYLLLPALVVVAAIAAIGYAFLF